MTVTSNFIEDMVASREPVCIFLKSGIKLNGVITKHDASGVILALDGLEQAIMADVIATVMQVNVGE